MKIVYVAAPLNAPTREGIEENRARASRWVAWIARTFGVATVCTWIVLSGEWEETDENLALGLRIDVELVEASEEAWLVGGRVSSGMAMETAEHPVVRDLTFLGAEPPESIFTLTPEYRQRLRDVLGPSYAYALEMPS